MQYATYARRSSRMWSGRKTEPQRVKTLANHAVLTREDLARTGDAGKVVWRGKVVKQ